MVTCCMLLQFDRQSAEEEQTAGYPIRRRDFMRSLGHVKHVGDFGDLKLDEYFSCLQNQQPNSQSECW